MVVLVFFSSQTAARSLLTKTTCAAPPDREHPHLPSPQNGGAGPTCTTPEPKSNDTDIKQENSCKPSEGLQRNAPKTVSLRKERGKWEQRAWPGSQRSLRTAAETWTPFCHRTETASRPAITSPNSTPAVSRASLTRGCWHLCRVGSHDEGLKDPCAELGARLGAAGRRGGLYKGPSSSAPLETPTPLGQKPATPKDLLWDWCNAAYPVGTGVMPEHHRWDGGSQLWLPPLENPWAEPLVGSHPAKPACLGASVPMPGYRHPSLAHPIPGMAGASHLVAAGQRSSSPKSSPRSRGERRLLRVPWQRWQKWWTSWRRSSAWGCGRAGGASRALARWPHSSKPGVSAAEGKPWGRNVSSRGQGMPLSLTGGWNLPAHMA